MKILIAPDSFKGSLSSRQAADAIAEGLGNRDITFEKVPLADGGSGTVDCLVTFNKGKIMQEYVTDPLGKKILVRFGVLPDDKTAIIEMASASGLTLIPQQKRDPLYTTTYGTGELIKKVIERGFSKIILGLGDSATTDCGAGALQALGAKLLDRNGRNICFGGLYLKDIQRIILLNRKAYKNIEIKFLYDVKNKLLGKNGTVMTFAQQKGANQKGVEILEENIEHFSKIVKRDTGIDITKEEGSGAAGGLGAGLSILFKSEFISGSEFIINSTGLKNKIEKSDMIITGEGELNSQTKYGKIPYIIAGLAKQFNKPVIGVFGNIAINARQDYRKEFSIITDLCESGITIDDAIKNASFLLREKIIRLFDSSEIKKILERI